MAIHIALGGISSVGDGGHASRRQVSRFRPGRPQRQIGLPALEIHRRGRTQNLKRDVGPAASKVVHGWSQQVGRDLFHRCEPHAAFGVGPRVRGSAGEGQKRCFGFLSVGQHARRVSSGREAPWTPEVERKSQLLFQLGNPATHRRLIHAQGASRIAEGSGPSDFEEDLHITPISHANAHNSYSLFRIAKPTAKTHTRNMATRPEFPSFCGLGLCLLATNACASSADWRAVAPVCAFESRAPKQEDSPMHVIKTTHIGTASVLLEIGPFRFLTDPAFDGPGNYSFGYGARSTKKAEPSIVAEAVGRIDAVLLSHDQHADNLDNRGRALLSEPNIQRVITTRPGRQTTPRAPRDR